MRRAAKVDANHGEIVRALEAVGARVQSLAAIGNGCPDLLVYRGQKLFLLEVKDGSKVPSAQRLTPAQVKWHATWGGSVHVVRNVDEALVAIGAMRPKFEAPHHCLDPLCCAGGL